MNDGRVYPRSSCVSSLSLVWHSGIWAWHRPCDAAVHRKTLHFASSNFVLNATTIADICSDERRQLIQAIHKGPFSFLSAVRRALWIRDAELHRGRRRGCDWAYLALAGQVLRPGYRIELLLTQVDDDHYVGARFNYNVPEGAADPRARLCPRLRDDLGDSAIADWHLSSIAAVRVAIPGWHSSTRSAQAWNAAHTTGG